jgi:hypothetical protein
MYTHSEWAKIRKAKEAGYCKADDHTPFNRRIVELTL